MFVYGVLFMRNNAKRMLLVTALIFNTAITVPETIFAEESVKTEETESEQTLSVNLLRGQSIQLSAGDNVGKISWAVSGSSESDTYVTQSGILHISSNEKMHELTVAATKIDNPESTELFTIYVDQETPAITSTENKKKEDKKTTSGDASGDASGNALLASAVKSLIEIDTTKLDALIEKAKVCKQSDYTKESFEAMEEECEKAQALLNDGLYTQQQIDQEEEVLEKALDGLEEKSNKIMSLINEYASFVLCGLAVVVAAIYLLTKKKIIHKKEDGQKKESEEIEEVSENFYKKDNKESRDESEETALLDNDESEETELLLSAKGFLKRVDTFEVIEIDQREFFIGKDSHRVNYCIASDQTVSRVHAKIENTGNGFVLVDLKSKNGTFLNGDRLKEDIEYSLKNGDMIRFATKEMKFMYTEN